MSSSPLCRTCGSPLMVSPSGPFCPVCVLNLVASGDEPAPASDPLDPSFPRAFGEYELLGEVGRGGMGLVFKARQRSLNRIVALKVLLTGKFSDETARRRFGREAESAAKLQHPHIVAIHEIGEAEGHPFITMDFIDGPNLAELCQGRPLPARTAAHYLREIARAVQVAHAAGILHRDLKPSNILVGPDQQPRVTDFGLAKFNDTADGPTVAGQVLGSPNYTSPEQATGRNEQISVASDVYGLGALLYHLVTGRAPFNAPTTPETLRLVLETEPPSPRLLNPALPLDLETICLKCLEKEPAKRYASAAEVADEVDRFLSDRAIRARPVSAAELAWRWCRRHPAAAGLAATVALALTTTSIVFYTSARRIERSRGREQAALTAREEDVYSMHMGLAALALSETNDPRDVHGRLESTRPTPGGRDLRGFEWRYLWQRSRGDAVATLQGHQHVVDTAAFSPDGSVIITHSLDGVLKLWEAKAGKEIQSYTGVDRFGGFTANGKELFFSRPDRTIWRLDVAAGKIEQALASTGRLIGVGADGQSVIVFGPEGLPVRRRLNPSTPSEAVADVPPDTLAVVSRDRHRLAISGRPYPGILIFDFDTQQQVARVIDPRPVIAIALSPDGERLVSGGFDAELKVWQIGQPDPVHHFRAFPDPVWGLAFSADGQWLAAGGHNRVLKLWRTADWSPQPVREGHENTVHTIAFSNDGTRMVSGGEDEKALVWVLPSQQAPTEVRRLLRGPQWVDRTPDLAFSPDSSRFAGTAADGTVKVWRSDTMECVASFPAEARTVAFSADGKNVLSSDYDGTVRQWATEGAKMGTVTTPAQRVANWQDAPLSSLDRIGVIAAQRAAQVDCSLCAIPSARDTLNAGSPGACTTLAMTRGTESVFVGLISGEIEVWDLEQRHLRFHFAAHKLPVSSLAVSPDGRYLASGGLDNTTKLWDAATGAPLATFYSHNRPVWALAFSPDGRTLASGSCDKSVVLCSVPLRRLLSQLWLYVGAPQGYEQEVRILRFSPDGNILAAGLGDGTVRFFRAAPFSVTDTASAKL